MWGWDQFAQLGDGQDPNIAEVCRAHAFAVRAKSNEARARAWNTLSLSGDSYVKGPRIRPHSCMWLVKFGVEGMFGD